MCRNTKRKMKSMHYFLQRLKGNKGEVESENVSLFSVTPERLFTWTKYRLMKRSFSLHYLGLMAFNMAALNQHMTCFVMQLLYLCTVLRFVSSTHLIYYFPLILILITSVGDKKIGRFFLLYSLYIGNAIRKGA